MITTLPVKQPGEAWYIPLDFSAPLGADSNPDAPEDIGEIVHLAAKNTATGQDETDAILDPGANQVSGQIAYIWIYGGEHNTRYKITCRIRAAVSNQVFELDCFLIVQER